MRIDFTRLLICAAAGLVGCHSAREGALAGGVRVPAQTAQFIWLSAACNDGPLELAGLGFERALSLSEKGDGLRLIIDTALAPQACRSTALWTATPSTGSQPWRFEPRALIAMPAGGACGATEREAVEGNLRLAGDVLEIATQRSPWCRGFDARFVYRRSDAQKLEPERIVMHYFAAWNSADADAIAGLFVDGGGLIEPFSKTTDGNYKRHEGRQAVRSWYAAAFASTPWLAMNLTAIEPGSERGHLTARWEYMDAQLAEPLHGRNLFVVAEGEIYETEIQLIDDPKPAAASSLPAAANPSPESSPVLAPAASDKVHAP